MNTKILQKSDWYIISIIAFVIWTVLIWDYFHGGVPSHYLLHDKDMPSIANWWGGHSSSSFCYTCIKNQEKHAKPRR
ncbi:MAG: hypothetical protein ACI9FN_002031 [Saprospiraceae bacterium]|jgi:hypothetical protein